MKLKEIIDKLNLEVITAADKLDKEITRGYCSDLMSDVMANSKQGDIWITLQIHQNIVAVSSLNNLSAIVIINDRKPEQETIEKAEKEGIPILLSKLPAFEFIGKLFNLGIRGTI